MKELRTRPLRKLWEQFLYSASSTSGPPTLEQIKDFVCKIIKLFYSWYYNADTWEHNPATWWASDSPWTPPTSPASPPSPCPPCSPWSTWWLMILATLLSTHPSFRMINAVETTINVASSSLHLKHVANLKDKRTTKSKTGKTEKLTKATLYSPPLGNGKEVT